MTHDDGPPSCIVVGLCLFIVLLLAVEVLRDSGALGVW